MTRELINAQITHVSYVDKGANKKRFFLSKSADKQPDPTFTKEVKLIKKENEQQLVYGIVYEPDVEDAHEDYMTAAEIEKAAHGFMKDARNIDTQHDFEAGVGEVVESYVAPVEFEMDGETIAKGSWVLVTKATNEIWEQIKKGDITGYSMAGTAETIEKKVNQSTPQDESILKGIIDSLKSIFGGETIKKGAVRENYKRNQRSRNVWAAWESLEGEYYGSRWDNRTTEVADFDRLKDAAADFLELISEIETQEDVQKALADKPKKEEDELKPEDLKKALEEAMQPLNDRIAKLEGPEEQPETDKPEDNQEDDILKQMKTVIKEAVQPIDERLAAIEKSRGVSQQSSTDQTGSKPIEKGYMGYFS